MIRRIDARPRIPPDLYEAGWRLRHGSYGWQCTSRSGYATEAYPAPGPAIEAAWSQAEPDHERLQKQDREIKRMVLKMEGRL